MAHKRPSLQGKVFIGGLDPAVTRDDIAEYCSQW